MAKMTKTKLKGLLETLDFKLDPNQIDAIFIAVRDEEVYLSWTRQSGKTETACAFLMEGAMGGDSGAYLAHSSDAVKSAMMRFVKAAKPLEEVGIVTKISTSNGFTEIEFSNGAIVWFRIRTAGKIVGMTLDRIVFDEAQKMSNMMMEEILPTGWVAESTKIMMCGTPPIEHDFQIYGVDTPWLQARARGYNWIEYSSAPEYRPDLPTDLAAAKKANPAWRRIPKFAQKLNKEREKMSHEAFCRQRLGVYKIPKSIELHDPELSVQQVKNFLTQVKTPGRVFTASLGILPTSELAYITLCDGTISEVAKTFDVSRGQLDEIVGWVFNNARMISTINIPANQRGKAVADLLKAKRLGNKVKLMSVPETSSQIDRFLKQTGEGSLKVYSRPEVLIALTSFWLAMVPTSGSMEIKAGVQADAAMVLSLVNATQEGKLTQRTQQYKLIRG